MSGAVGRAVRVGGLDGVLLARSERGDGRHQVVSARLGGRDVVVKVYARKRAYLPTALARASATASWSARRGSARRPAATPRRGCCGSGARTASRCLSVLELAPPEPIAAPLPRARARRGPHRATAPARAERGPLGDSKPACARFAAEWSRRHALAETAARAGPGARSPGLRAPDRLRRRVGPPSTSSTPTPTRVGSRSSSRSRSRASSPRSGARPRRALRPCCARWSRRIPTARASSASFARGAVGRFRALEPLARLVPALRAPRPAQAARERRGAPRGVGELGRDCDRQAQHEARAGRGDGASRRRRRRGRSRARSAGPGRCPRRCRRASSRSARTRARAGRSAGPDRCLRSRPRPRSPGRRRSTVTLPPRGVCRTALSSRFSDRLADLIGVGVDERALAPALERDAALLGDDRR